MAETRILVIDDEKPICEFCAIALERIPNVVVTTEHKAKTALKFCESGKFDLVLTDLNMPDTSGVEVLKRVKASNPDTASDAPDALLKEAEETLLLFKAGKAHQ